MVASRPLTGDAVTVTVIPAGTQSATACSVPLAGSTSYRGLRSSASRPVTVQPPPRARQALLQPGYPGIDPGQRQPEQPRHPLRLGGQRRGGLLRQPDQPPIVTEIIGPQL